MWIIITILLLTAHIAGAILRPLYEKRIRAFLDSRF